MAKKPTEKNAKLQRKMCDRLWSRAVRHDWADRCAVCGKQATDAHHMIPRTNYTTRFELMNGIALCTHCHIWHPKLSPHQNGMAFKEWLKEHHPARIEWFHEHEHIKSSGTKTASFYCAILRDLKQYVEPEEFESIVGVKFSAWLEANPVEET
jgi:hypothetical protein